MVSDRVRSLNHFMYEYLQTNLERLQDDFQLQLQRCGGRKWVFPKIGVLPNHPSKNRGFHYKPSHFGVSLFLETPKLMGAPVLFGEGNFFLKELRVLWTWKVDHEDGEEAHEISNHRL